MKQHLIAIGLILLAVVITQGPSVRYGLLLDDYNHRAELRESDGSFRSLVAASHLGGHRRRVQMWWQDEADLYFFRPLAFFLMRAEYVVVGWRPDAMHAFSLAWTAAAATLVMLIARNVLGSTMWGGLAGVLFVMHPANYLTGRWIACQNEQMATTFALGALLLYARWSGWRWSGTPEPQVSARADDRVERGQAPAPSALEPIPLPEPRASARADDRAERGQAPAPSAPEPVPLPEPVPSPEPRASARAALPNHGQSRTAHACLLAALLCCIAALACRESAVMLPFLLLIGDWFARPHRTKGRRAVYLILGIILIAYAIVRHVSLGGAAMPGPPYACTPDRPGFARFVADKFIYYILALFIYLPVVGFEGLRVLRSCPGFFYGTFVRIVIVWAILLWCLRRRRILRFLLLLAVVPLIPVLPVFASAHHLYLASVGTVIATLALARWAMGWAEGRRSIIRTGVRGVMIVLILVHLVGFAVANVAYDTVVAGFSAASQIPVDEVAARAGALKPGDRLFFINLPMLGFNCMVGIEEATGVAPLEGYVLTFAPALTAMDRPGYVQRVSENELRVWLDDGYFAGLAGDAVLAAMGRDRPFAPGETFRGPDFDVEIIQAGASGVRELLFTFERPLDDPSYHFFFASPQFSAYPLRFESWPPPPPGAATATGPGRTPQTAASHSRNDTAASR